ncbi:hypothetical protein TPHA_0A05290 [Tetrapisispora phaffii CBS 4417]|uniref:Cdc23 domain-containing protein n=1 Tax=Tetrapisispora phaffii (strain ATCC 24235 / CBS 4417 / NBRC 1672 / NRRL Y-8282 / UCD 70-5) TaxID=1071381 RepID=G8BNX5_TETPH|nr:hypothetical protein TPHA_0A05290 [Tetrapisispora phaffii CBS 4417]CCE61603.1 hypothetical protein TPHA_0A05290 [Tetrapisispora phaffii CBS 4417]
MDSHNQFYIIQDIRNCLRKSAIELSQVKLYKSSKWSAEALLGILEFESDMPEDDTIIRGAAGALNFNDSPLSNQINHGHKQSNKRSPFIKTSADNAEFTQKEYDLHLFASTLFDSKEFDRCSFFLKDVTHPKLKFMKLYCEYLSWDKKVKEKMENLLTTGKTPKYLNDKGNTSLFINGRDDIWANSMSDGSDCDKSHDTIGNLNFDISSHSISMNEGKRSSLSSILNELNDYLKNYNESLPTLNIRSQSSEVGIALLYYLKGILEKKENNKSLAMSSFLKSLSKFTFNWTCWVELLDCITKADEFMLLTKYLSEKFKIEDMNCIGMQSDVNHNIMIKFFKLVLFQEFSGDIDNFLENLESLLNIFPNFSFLKAQNALINYNYMDYVNAEQLFEQIIKADPYRLDDLDFYSNILYVMQKQPKLSYLAQFCSQVDRFRPETCCIIANYYSARQEHEKSILYFRRAITLNKKNISAWTLMGHEFVELKNSQAAIECYRHAVDINPRDFKAWYGLGQAYEVLDMHLYSLYYFQKACTLKPLDKRMWQALASCYVKIGNFNDAIKSFERALQLSINTDQDSSLLYKLAEVYEKSNDLENCKEYMIRCVNVEALTEGFVTDEIAKARLWLARYELSRQNFEEAYGYAIGVSTGSTQDIEEARAIARECRKQV